MQVKIIKAWSYSWYSREIGNVYDVQYNKHTDTYDCIINGTTYHILLEDAEIIKQG